MVHIRSFSRRLLPAALALTLGFGSSSCEKILDVEPLNSLDATAGLTTPADVQAATRGSYDILQSANYWGLRYQLFADLAADNARHTGTFPSFANIANAAILPDNVEVTNMWNTIYAGINRVNYVIQQAERLNDPSFDKNTPLAELRALRAFHYMNLLAYWGGTPAGYGYANGVGVPLRLTPTTSILGEEIKPIARSTEAEVVAAIREDFNFAIENLPDVRSSKSYLGKAAVLALRARLELRLRNYEAAADYAAQADEALGGLNVTTGYEAVFTQKFSAESIWEIGYDPVDANSIAFFWFPAASGGRNEVDPATGLGPAHETGDLRRNVNVVTAATAVPNLFPSGTTRKYYRIASGDDNVILVRGGEVALTWAEALARTGQLEPAAELVNRIRNRAGLAALSAETVADQTLLVNAILKERRVELANEGFRWFDLRRTGLVQTTLPLVTQEFRNLWPIPQRELQTSNGLIVQNTGY